MCGTGIVIILSLNRTLVSLLITAIADIRSFLNLLAGFSFKAGADVVASMAGTAKGITDDELVASVGLLTTEAMETKVVGIVKTAPVPSVYNTMLPNLFGDSGKPE